MKTLIAILSITLTINVNAITGNELLKDCILAVDQNNRSFSAGKCVGFIRGFSAAQLYYKPAYINECMPAGVTMNQYVRVLVKYLGEHPERLHYSAWVNTHEAFSAAFCKKE